MLATEQIQRYRLETPGTQHHIHLNNAGAALMPEPVTEAIKRHLELESDHGGYEAAAMARGRIQGFYQSLAKLLKCEPRNIAFATNATDAYSRALSAIPFRKGDSILTTREDYVSNQLAFLQLVRRFGIKIRYADTLPAGGVDPDSVRDMIQKERPRLVAVTHMPTYSGLIQDVAAVGRICREHDILYLVDGCQTAGQLDLDMKDIGCDFFSATFRKFLRGPRGTGFLFVSDRVLESGLHPLFIDLHSANWTGDTTYRLADSARRFELWERAYALVLGARAATEYALAVNTLHIEQRVRQLANDLRQKLELVDKIEVLDRGTALGGIVTLHVSGWNPNNVKAVLEQATINCSLVHTESARFDFQERGIEWALRLSPHYYNLNSDLDEVTGILDAQINRS